MIPTCLYPLSSPGERILVRLAWALVFGVVLSCPTNGQEPGTLKWKYSTGGYIHSSPAIDVDGTVYFGSVNQMLHALNPDGSVKWVFATDGSVNSSPAIGEDGTVYASSDYQDLYAVHPDGTLKWSYRTAGGESSPAIGADGTVYVGSNDYRIYAITPEGSLKWRYQTGYRITSSPAIGADGTVYVGSMDGYLYALTLDGRLRWRFRTGHHVESSPAIGPDGRIYVGSGDERVYAFDPDGSLVWSYKTGSGVSSSPALAPDGTLVVGSGDRIIYLLRPDGTVKSRVATGGNVVSSPAIGADGNVYVGTWDGRLHALDCDGKPLWSFKTPTYVKSSPAIAGDGTVYVGSAGSLYAIHGTSAGLADSSWPRFHRDSRGAGSVQKRLVLLGETDFVFVGSDDQVELELRLANNTASPAELLEIHFDSAVFGSSLPLPATAEPGATVSIPVVAAVADTRLYETSVRCHFRIDGENATTEGTLLLGAFLDDGSETSVVARRTYDAYRQTHALDPRSPATLNNLGLLFRLLGESERAEVKLMQALSASLNKRFGYSGITLNLGVVKSDQGSAGDARSYYEAALDTAAGAVNVLEPQVLYNRAWEALDEGNLAEALVQVDQVLAHSRSTSWILAKADVLRGVLWSRQGEKGRAAEDFRSAAAFDPDGPIGRMAEENLAIVTDLDGESPGWNPGRLVFAGAYPNPFLQETHLLIDIPALSGLEVSVYDALGRRVRRLDVGVKLPGRHVVLWDGRDDAGRLLAAGRYLIRARADSDITSLAVTLVR